MATQSVTQSIIESIISPKIVDDGTGGYVEKTDIVNVHNLQVDTINCVEPVFGGGSSFTNDHFGTVTFTHNSGGVIQIQNADTNSKWTRVLPNGEVLNGAERVRRLHLVINFLKVHFNPILSVFSDADKSTT
jgi:hypothetical protein